MSLRSAVLKPAAWLLFGASAVFGSTDAHAAGFYYFGWNSSFTGVSSSGPQKTFSGSGTLEATQLVAGDFTQWQITRIWGTWDGQAITGLLTEINTTLGFGYDTLEPIDNKFTTQNYLSLQTFGALTEFGYGWTTASTQYNVYRKIFPDEQQAFINSSGLKYAPISVSPFNINIVPAPLPILGLPAVLFYSRRIKKRIKASKTTAVIS